MGGRRCDLCGGTYFSSRCIPACAAGQQCPRAFGHKRGDVVWIDGRRVAVDLLEEILRRRNTAHSLSASSLVGDAGGETVRAALQQLLETPLPDEPSGAGDEPTAGAAESRGSFPARSPILGDAGLRSTLPQKAPPPYSGRGGSSGISGPYTCSGFKPPSRIGGGCADTKAAGAALPQDPRLLVKPPPTRAQYAAYEEAQRFISDTAAQRMD